MIMNNNISAAPLIKDTAADSDSERSSVAAGPGKSLDGQAVSHSFSMPLSSYALSTRKAGVRVSCPSPADILLGRGKPFQSHPGNQRMLQIVDAYRQRYLRAERKEKHSIVEEVISAIRATGGRFLSRVEYENYWIEVNHAISYRKVGHAFRSKARRTESASAKAKASRTNAFVPPMMMPTARTSERMPLPMLPGTSTNQMPSPPMGPVGIDRMLPGNNMPQAMANVPMNGMFRPGLGAMNGGQLPAMAGPMFSRGLPGQQPNNASLLSRNRGNIMPNRAGESNIDSLREAVAVEKAMAAESLARAQMLESAALAQRHLDEARIFQDQLFSGNQLPQRRFF